VQRGQLIDGNQQALQGFDNRRFETPRDVLVHRLTAALDLIMNAILDGMNMQRD
jgi:hypothetical protein